MLVLYDDHLIMASENVERWCILNRFEKFLNVFKKRFFAVFFFTAKCLKKSLLFR